MLHAIHLKTGGFSASRHPILRIELARALPVGDDFQWLDAQVAHNQEVDPVAGEMVGFQDHLSWNLTARTHQELKPLFEAWLARASREGQPIFVAFGAPMVRRFLAANPSLRPESATDRWLDDIRDLATHANLLKNKSVVADAKLATVFAHYRMTGDVPATDTAEKLPTGLQVLQLARAMERAGVL